MCRTMHPSSRTSCPLRNSRKTWPRGVCYVCSAGLATAADRQTSDDQTRANLKAHQRALSDLENFFLFCRGQILDLLGLRVGDFFQFVQRPFLFVLTDFLVLLQLVDS